MRQARSHCAILLPLLFFSLAAVAWEQTGQVPVYELKLERFFPTNAEDESVVWLAAPRAMACFESGETFVYDGKAKAILKFDPSGRFVKKFGGHGQGPGDFLNVLEMIADGDKLHVYDGMKHEIALYSLEGELLESIRVPKFYHSIALARGRYYGADLRSDRHLVDALDADGNFLFSFGARIPGSGSLNWTVIAGGESSVAVLFTNTALIRTYGLDGRLVGEETFEEFPVLAMENRENLKAFRNYEPGRTPYRHLFDNICRADGFWHILRNGPDGPEIIVKDSDLKSRAVYMYRAPGAGNGMVWDLAKPSSAETFYLLRSSPEARVEVLVPALERPGCAVWRGSIVTDGMRTSPSRDGPAKGPRLAVSGGRNELGEAVATARSACWRFGSSPVTGFTVGWRY